MKMAPLKQLEREHPIIDANFRDFCASHGIFSTEDFLLQDLYVLAAFAGQQKGADRLEEGIVKMLFIIDSQCQPCLNGMELLEDAQKSKHALSTGNEVVDLLLGGGFREGQLIELVGPSSSGKTQICMQAATSVAEKHMGSVLYLDTGNSFSPQRIAYFISPASDAPFNQAKHKHVQIVLSRISCQPVFDIFAMLDVLQLLELDLKLQMNTQEERLRLLIIDSISSLITPILGGRGSQGRALMVAAGYLLKKLAHEYNLSVLVTNHMVAGEGGNSKPALGETWKSIPHARLQLSRDHRSNLCNMLILKHPSVPSGKAARFKIYND